MNKLLELSVGELTAIIAGGIVVCRWLWKIVKKILTGLNLFYKKKSEYERKEEEEAQQKAEMAQMQESINSLISSFHAFIEKNKKDNQALLRDRIQQIYHLTLQKKYITEYDLKNFTHLMDRYEVNDGNSYIVDIVKPYIKSVRVYLDDDEVNSESSKK